MIIKEQTTRDIKAKAYERQLFNYDWRNYFIFVMGNLKLRLS